jgi:hypothetical protein
MEALSITITEFFAGYLPHFGSKIFSRKSTNIDVSVAPLYMDAARTPSDVYAGSIW